MAKTLYEIIGVSERATKEEIEEACQKLGEFYRPDKNTGNIDAYERFAEIDRAYEILIDPEKRATYDLDLAAKSKSPQEILIKTLQVNLSRESHWRYSWFLLALTWLILWAWFLVQDNLLVGSKPPSVFAFSFLLTLIVIGLLPLEFFVRLLAWIFKAAVKIPETIFATWAWVYRFYLIGALAITVLVATLSGGGVNSGSGQDQLMVDTSCTVNGLGDVTCTFRNRGDKSQSVCAYVSLQRNDPSYGGDVKKYLKFLDGQISSESVCSGIIAPQDVRQIKQSVLFKNSNGVVLKPHEYCATASPLSWTDVCKLETNVMARKN